MARNANALNDTQSPLFPSSDYREKGDKLRSLLNRTVAAARLSHEDLARETQIDEKQIGRALRNDGGAHPPLALVACILKHDLDGVFITSLAAMLGYEARPKAPDLAAENTRLRSELSRVREQITSLLEGTP